MDVLTRDKIKELKYHENGPCVSVYMPAHRVQSEEDGIRWKNQLNAVEEHLVQEGMRRPDAGKLLARGRMKFGDRRFWQHQSDGLAGFFSPELSRIYRLPYAFQEEWIVAPRFHIKPLLPIYLGDARFFLLAISQKGVKFFQGTRFTFDEVDLEGVPASLAEALQYDEKLSQLQLHAQPAVGVGAGRGGKGPAMFHGQGVGIDDKKNDLLRYFQQIDRGLHDYLREESAPLVLAGVESSWPIYREANTYPHLLEDGVAGNPDRTKPGDLHQQAWKVVRKALPDPVPALNDRFAQLASTEPKRVSRDIGEIVRAADEGRVEALLIASDRMCWGEWDRESGRVNVHGKRRANSEDLLNVALIKTLANDGQVCVIPADEVPGDGWAATIFRWPS